MVGSLGLIFVKLSALNTPKVIRTLQNKSRIMFKNHILISFQTKQAFQLLYGEFLFCQELRLAVLSECKQKL